MKTQSIKINQLRLDSNNARTHDDKNLEAIKSSLERFGQQKPIVITDDNTVVAGNGTLTAALSLSWTHIDCVRTSLDGDEATAYAIADNKTAELAVWDENQLADTLLRLEESNVDALVTGFTQEEIDKLVDNDTINEANAGDDRNFEPEFLILITCENEMEQGQVFEKCEKLGYTAKIVS